MTYYLRAMCWGFHLQNVVFNVSSTDGMPSDYVSSLHSSVSFCLCCFQPEQSEGKRIGASDERTTVSNLLHQGK